LEKSKFSQKSKFRFFAFFYKFKYFQISYPKSAHRQKNILSTKVFVGLQVQPGHLGLGRVSGVQLREVLQGFLKLNFRVKLLRNLKLFFGFFETFDQFETFLKFCEIRV